MPQIDCNLLCYLPATRKKARLYYERGMKPSLFLLLIFPGLKSKRALSEAKKSVKQTKNAPFHARSEYEP